MDSNKTFPEESRISSPLQSIFFTGEFPKNGTHVEVHQDAGTVKMTIISFLHGKRFKAVLVGKPEDYVLEAD